MAIIHTQYNDEVVNPDGTKSVVPSKAALLNRGPVIQVSITVAQSIANQIIQQGQVLPQPINGWALLDTGASSSCVDEKVAQQLSLPVVDIVEVSTASHAGIKQNAYPIHIECIGTTVTLDVNKALGAYLESQNLVALIGRDVLQHCIFFYKGVAGQITLSIS